MDVTQHKTKLLEDKVRLERELAGVGRETPGEGDGWEATPGEMEKEADPIDAADQVEEFESRSAVEFQLEKQLKDVEAALARIEQGTYGNCSEGDGNHMIEEKRLTANPSATTCMAHMN